MKIGLVRHFKVITPKINKRLNSSEFNSVMNNYDSSPIKPNDIQINQSDWDVCYASTLLRADETAKSIFGGEIISTDMLIEVPLTSFMRTNLFLPNILWHVGGRIAWFFSSATQRENISETKMRIHDFMQLLENSGKKNILIVSHGFFMKVFAHQLKKKGFIGTIDFTPKNGKLYLFEKQTFTIQTTNDS